MEIDDFIFCSFCGQVLSGDIPTFRGKDAFICGKCVNNFANRVVRLDPFRHREREIEPAFQCPSCNEIVHPTLCPHCNFSWNPADMATNLIRVSRVSKIYEWAVKRFPDQKYFLSVDFDLIRPGSITVYLTLPLHHRANDLEEQIGKIVELDPSRGDSVDIRYDDLFFARF